jgi:hypothetical protein
MNNDARVTIVVVPREQFSKSQISLETIHAATPPPFDWASGRMREVIAGT